MGTFWLLYFSNTGGTNRKVWATPSQAFRLAHRGAPGEPEETPKPTVENGSHPCENCYNLGGPKPLCSPDIVLYLGILPNGVNRNGTSHYWQPQDPEGHGAGIPYVYPAPFPLDYLRLQYLPVRVRSPSSPRPRVPVPSRAGCRCRRAPSRRPRRVVVSPAVAARTGGPAWVAGWAAG